jgi:oligoendopeptidase F
MVPIIISRIRTKHMERTTLFSDSLQSIYQEIFVFVKNALMCHYHQTEQKWSTSRDALTPYLQYKGVVYKRRHQFSRIEEELRYLCNTVMRVGSDTFGDPIFQKGLQN